jgi:hypothetical protein
MTLKLPELPHKSTASILLCYEGKKINRFEHTYKTPLGRNTVTDTKLYNVQLKKY